MFDLEKIVRKNIWGLTPYSSARDEFKGSGDVFLDANENPFGTLNRYPDPRQLQLKQQLSAVKNVEANQIFIGNGSDEIIDLAFRICCEPSKDKALAFSPTYGMYDVSAGINAVELLKQPLTKDFQIDLESLKPLLSNSSLKLIFICSPNNPTGTSIRTEQLTFILKNFRGIVILDEAYIDFSPRASFIQYSNEYSNLIVCQTFSKSYGLAGARVGVAYANPQIISLYNKVKPPYNVSTLNQEAALKALSDSNSFRQRIKTILAEKAVLENQLQEVSMVKKIYPSDANFLLVEVDDADRVYRELISLKIITRNRNKLVKNCIRITVGSPEENQQLIRALKKL